MSKVLLVLGSDSDFPKVKPALAWWQKMGVSYDLCVASAHRSPAKLASLAQTAQSKGYAVLIGAAGLAAHLPGVIAAFTTLPVIGLPLSAPALNGWDALLAMAQMPPGVPVATVAIDGALNAAILAAQISALTDTELALRLLAYKANLAEQVEQKNANLQQLLAEENGANV